MKKGRLSSFQKAIFVSFCFSGLASILNYLFQIILGNMLQVEAFGVYNSINSLVANVAIVFTPLSIIACQITASRQEENNLNVYKQIFKISLGISGIIFVIGILIFQEIQGKFGANNLAQWINILLVICISGIFSIVNSIVQGKERFVLYGIIGIFLVLVKLIISVISISSGMGISGIVGAMFLSYLSMIVMAGIFLKHNLSSQSKAKKNFLDKRFILQQYGVTFFAQILFSFYINGGEIILMGYLFEEWEVGLYSSAAMIGKVSLYIISIFSVVLFPRVASKSNQGMETRDIFYKILGFSTLFGIVYAGFLAVGGKRLIPLMFGKEYEQALPYINSIIVLLIPLNSLSIIHNYFMGIGKVREYSAVLGIITVLAIISIVCTEKIIYVPIVLGVGLYIVIIWSLWYVRQKLPNNI